MKKKVAIIVIFIVLLIFPVVSWPLAIKIDKTEIDENRALAEAPEFGDDFFQQFDSYFVDHAPYRNFLIKLYNDCDRSMQKFYEQILKLFNIPYYTAINDVLFGKENWLFYLAEQSYEYYIGNNLPTEEELSQMVEKAEKVNNYFKSIGKEFIIYTAPDKEQIYDNMMPLGINVESEIKRPEVIANYFVEHSDVKVLYPREELLKHRDDLQLYFKNDTHWNNAGAYFGANEILKALNMPIFDATFTAKPVGGGDLSSMAALKNLTDTDYDVIYRTDIEMTIEEQLEPTIENRKNDFHCHSSNANGKNLMFVGDSFRMSMINILAKNFETSTFTFVEHIYGEEFLKDVKDADVVVFQAVERGEKWLFLDGCLDTLIQIFNL